MTVVILARRRRRRGQLARWVALACDERAIRFVSDLAEYLTIVRAPPAAVVLGVLDLASLDEPLHVLVTLLGMPLGESLLNAVVVPQGAEPAEFLATREPPLGTVLVSFSHGEIADLVDEVCRHARADVLAS
jgi:hypothetical protein